MSAQIDEDPFETILDADAEYLFMNTDRLPTATRNFIRLQNEIAYRDTGETLSMLAPTLIESKYAIKGMRFRKMRSKEEKEEYIRKFLADMERFFHEIFQAFSRAEAAEAYYQKVENYIETTLKVLDKHQTKAFAPVIQQVLGELEQAKSEILEHKETLTSRRLPNATQVQAINEDLGTKMSALKSLSLGFKNRFTSFLHRYEKGMEPEPAAEPEPEAAPFPSYYTPPGAAPFTLTIPSAGGKSSSVTITPGIPSATHHGDDEDEGEEAPPGPTSTPA